MRYVSYNPVAARVAERRAMTEHAAASARPYVNSYLGAKPRGLFEALTAWLANARPEERPSRELIAARLHRTPHGWERAEA